MSPTRAPFPRNLIVRALLLAGPLLVELGCPGIGFVGVARAEGEGPGKPQGISRDPVAAEELFRAGKELLKANNWPLACEKFQQSMEFDPAVSTLVKIAKCREHEGLLATAWNDYQRALKLNRETTQAERRRQELQTFIEARVAELSPRVPRLRIKVQQAPEGLELWRDGTERITSALTEPLPIDPGSHQLSAKAPGWRAQPRSIEITEGQQEEIELTLVRDEVTPPPAPAPVGPSSRPLPPATPATPAPPPWSPPAPASEGHSNPGSTRRSVGWAVGGSGLATLGVAAYFGVHTLSLANSMRDECVYGCTDLGIQFHDRAARAQLLGFVLAGIGTAAVATGVVLIATAPKGATSTQAIRVEAKPRSPLSVLVGPGFITAGGAF